MAQPLQPLARPARTDSFSMRRTAFALTLVASAAHAQEPSPAPEKLPDSASDVAGALLRSLGGMVNGFIENLPQLGVALIVLLLTALAAKLATRLIGNIARRVHLKESLRDLFGQFVRIGVWLVGLMLAASIVFPGFGPAQIVATAGLASIAIGFAFKDIFENFFAGILILWNYPFETGDFIEIEDTDIEGRVEDIWIRVTLIRKTNGELIIVPNSKLYSSAVRVLTNQRLRRLTVICGVAYAEDVDQSRAVITGAVESCVSVSKEKPIQVFAQEFAESSINFEVTWWTGSTPLEHRKSKDEVITAVKRALDEAGIEIPFPYRTLTFKKGDPLHMAPRSEDRAL